MRSNLRLALVFVGNCLSAGSSFAAPGEPASANFDHAGLAREVIERYVRPETRAFAEAADALATDVAKSCEKPTRKARERARQSFKSAALAYAHFEMLRIGPTHEQHRQERLLLFPDPKGLVRKHVAKALSDADRSILEPGALAKKSVTLQGFPALELALFNNPTANQAKSANKDGFRCGYAEAIAQNIAAIAKDIRDGWADEQGFSKLMQAPAADNPAYMTDKEVTLEIVSTLLNGLEQVRDIRIASPLGLREFGKAETGAIFETSGMSLPFISANIDGLLMLYQDGGIKDRLARNDKSMADVIAFELRTARDLAASVDKPFSVARRSKQDRSKLVAIGFPLKNARSLAATLSSDATGLSIGFNAGDGD